jgi:hypothetical protein
MSFIAKWQGAVIYPIDPYRPVHEIVDDLQARPESAAEIDLGRSVARAIHIEDPDAVLAYALAYCVWRGARLDGRALADMVETMIACGARGAGLGTNDDRSCH